MKKKIILILGVILVLVILFVCYAVFFGGSGRSKNTTFKLECSNKNINNYKVDVITKYKDNKVDFVEYKYKNLDDENKKLSDDIIKYIEIMGSKYYVEDKIMHVSFDREAYEASLDNKELKKIFNDNYDDLKKYYESLGYTCK